MTEAQLKNDRWKDLPRMAEKKNERGKRDGKRLDGREGGKKWRRGQKVMEKKEV